MAQPTRSEAPQSAGWTVWVVICRPQRGKPGNSSVAFTGGSPIENWRLQGAEVEPWNAVRMVAVRVGGSGNGPSRVSRERNGHDAWSTKTAAGSP